MALRQRSRRYGAVQAKLNEQRNNHTVARSETESLLIGRIYDDRGNRIAWLIGVATAYQPYTEVAV
jgi:hypothetical protein